MHDCSVRQAYDSIYTIHNLSVSLPSLCTFLSINSHHPFNPFCPSTTSLSLSLRVSSFRQQVQVPVELLFFTKRNGEIELGAVLEELLHTEGE
ncbi:unnamed protein product [Rhodiola kirilowii]